MPQAWRVLGRQSERHESLSRRHGCILRPAVPSFRRLRAVLSSACRRRHRCHHRRRRCCCCPRKCLRLLSLLEKIRQLLPEGQCCLYMTQCPGGRRKEGRREGGKEGGRGERSWLRVSNLPKTLWHAPNANTTVVAPNAKATDSTNK